MLTGYRLRSALLAAIPVLLDAQVCVPVPTPNTTITQSTLDEVRKRGVLAPGVSAFANLEAFSAGFGGSLPYIPQSAANQKWWADFTPGNDYVTVDTSPDGALDTTDSSTWSDFSMSVYGRTVANFYQGRAIAKDAVFRKIPRFRRFTTTQPGDLNMTAGVGKPGPRIITSTESPYPLARLMDDPVAESGKRWSWATTHILRFHPVTGQVEACDYQEYTRAYPIVTTVSVGGGSGGKIRIRSDLTPEAFLSNVGAAMWGAAGTPADRAALIIRLLEVQ